MVALGASAAVATAVKQISAAHATSAARTVFAEIDLRAGFVVGFESATFNMTTSVGYCQFRLN